LDAGLLYKRAERGRSVARRDPASKVVRFQVLVDPYRPERVPCWPSSVLDLLLCHQMETGLFLCLKILKIVCL
jgi:hypothetical protein